MDGVMHRDVPVPRSTGMCESGRLERLCGTSLCPAPADGYPVLRGRAGARANLLLANLSNSGALLRSFNLTPNGTSNKKAPLRGLFYWMARLERLCGTSLCRTPTAGSAVLRGRAGARPKSLRAILSNWEFEPVLQPRHPIKKPPYGGCFIGWRAWRDSNSRPLGS